jgi:glycopeptide antibiotics resistance protein
MGVPFVYPLFLVLLVALTVFSVLRAAASSATPRSWVAIAIAVWLAATVFMTVRPGTGLGVRLNLIPFVVDGPGSAVDAFRNLFVFVPLGMLLAILGWRILAVLGAALAISLSIEIVQYATDWGRTADVNDLITNVASVALGWFAAWLIRRVVTRRRASALPAPETS